MSLKYYDDYIALRCDIFSYLNKHLIPQDTFYLDILKDLSDADVACDRYITLLVLEQYSNLLLPNSETVEQCIGCLFNLYKTCSLKETKKNPLKKIWQFKGQILVTVTSILLSRQDNLEGILHQDLLRDLELLLRKEADEGFTYFIQSIACQCLQELESFFPGYLGDLPTIEHIKKYTTSKKNPITPQFLSLYFLILNNKKEREWHETPLQKEENDEDNQILLFLINSLPLLGPTTLHSILNNSRILLERCSSAMLWKLKPRIEALCSTYDLAFIQLLLNLQKNFGNHIMNKATETYFTKQLLRLCYLPCVPKTHQLLCMEWINQHLPLYKDKYSHWLVYQTFTPNPFEGPDTFEKKVKVMVNLPASFKEDQQSSILLQCLEAIEKCIHKSNNIRPLGSLFRSLFISFKRWHNSEDAEPFIKLILNMLLSLLPCSEHFNNFHNQINLLFPNCVALNILKGQLISHTCTFQPEKAISCWEYYYRLLNNLLNQPQRSEDIKNLIIYWQTLLKQNKTVSLNENVGKTMLEMVANILRYQDFQNYNEEILDLLHYMIAAFKQSEIAVIAKLYNNALTTLSTEKVKEVLSKFSKNKTNFLTSQYKLASPTPDNKVEEEEYKTLPKQLILMDNSVFDLQRDSDKNASNESYPEFIPHDEDSCVEEYNQYIETHEQFSSLPLNFKLGLKPGVKDNFKSVYAVVCSIQTQPTCDKIGDILIPCLKEHYKSVHSFQINLVPKLAPTITLHFRTEFSAVNLNGYCIKLPTEIINFCDLFFPLPVHNSYKKLLFDNLWKTLFPGFKWLPLSTQQTRKMIRDHWEPLVIPGTETDLGIILIGKHHALLQFRPADCGGTMLRMVVDDPLILALFEVYLKNLIPLYKEEQF